MAKPGNIITIRSLILLVFLLLTTACGQTFQGDEFIFSAPFGFKTKQYEIPDEVDADNSSIALLFSQNGSVYLQVFRRQIPAGGDLETVFNNFKTQSIERSSHYQFISLEKIEIFDRPGIEYIYREFSGEPYWQRREIWVENNGQAYALVCSHPADATPGLVIPVTERCISIIEGFQFE